MRSSHGTRCTTVACTGHPAALAVALLHALTWAALPDAHADTSARERGNPMRSMGLTVDNDVLAFARRDSDYTGGISFTLTADRDARWALLPTTAWRWLDLGVPTAPPDTATRTVDTLQFGLMAFTPENIRATEPLPTERPYASLLFATASTTHVHGGSGPAYTASLTVGVIGLRLAGDAQRGLHQILGQQKVPNGWANQISAGGEPTAQLSWARQQLLVEHFADRSHRVELKWLAQLDAGYLTEGSVALAGRWGALHSPWWGYGGERSGYVTHSLPPLTPRTADGGRDLYVWATARLRARAYNALLHGQWRDSPARLPSSQAHHVLADAAVGVNWQFTRHWRLSYVARYKTPEVRQGAAARDLVWAGLTVSRNL